MPAPLFLSLEPYLQQFSAVEYISVGNAQLMLQILHQNKNNCAGTEPSNGAIWDEFGSIKTPYSMLILHFLVKIKFKIISHFG